MWRYWNPYYHPDPPKWLFLIIFWAPLLSLFLLGYFVMSFRVIEQIPVPIAVNASVENITGIILNPDYNASDYDSTYFLLKKREIEIGNITSKHYKGYGSNAYLTANIFFGGAEFNKTGGTGVLAFLEAATCFLVIFVVTYLVYDLLNPKPRKIDFSHLFYPQIPITKNEEEELFMAALFREKAVKSRKNPELVQKIGWIFEDIGYDPEIVLDSENVKSPKFCFGIRPPISRRFLMAVLFFGLVISPALYIACLLVSMVYSEPTDIFPILEMARRSWGIDLKLELVYTVGSWIYSIAVTAFALSFHGGTLLTAKILHWLIFE